MTYRLTYEDVEEMVWSGLAGTSEECELGRLSELAEIRYKYAILFCLNGRSVAVVAPPAGCAFCFTVMLTPLYVFGLSARRNNVVGSCRSEEEQS